LRISVIMPVLNRANHIRRAIDSVDAQGIADVEIIAVDGGSTDGTREILAAVPNVRLIDAPRSSIYEALNIAVGAAQGTWISHLNSDDRLVSGALARVLDLADRQPDSRIIRGWAHYVAEDATGAQHPLPRINNAVRLALDLHAVLFGIPAINACIIHKDVYGSIGLYDERYRIAADREWLLRALLAKVPISLLDAPVYEYLVHGGSLTMATRHRSEQAYACEHMRMAEDHLSRITDREMRAMLYAFHAQEMVRYLLRAGGNPSRLAEIKRAFRFSPAWPILSLRPLYDAALRKLGT
jgi:glycosyltransferase involved in cell wall biosynthesis